ncbi:hypothetical protein LN924_000686 [Acinetobacter baumannii]|uniref:hypothetical protein n=1 Tax=Acinetobacter baumannii TaxID=470 RepID=UPI0011296F17|nr:hypothetical protein [Acinetobacter baumannii]EKU2471041.1 hypothetical protein [Acinetobacter baumannii]EKU2472794.1 hypothetical protein [Acinetobacter baumannii]TPU14426.1 hypothetical protein FJU86_16790 [Acinetobacter baumannii]
MTDLNKLRIEFEEAYLSVGGKERDLEIEDGEYTNSKSQLGWELWQIKAKAQAVPEGYVLLPRVPTEKFKEDLKQHLDELWWGDHGCDWDGFVSVNGIDPLKIYALAIEASESGAEGWLIN